jgi:HEPN domain-containing protein
MNKQVRVWLRSAEEDLLWAEHNLRGKFYPQACFAAQQAAEKALKAYLLEKRGRFDKIHKTFLPLMTRNMLAKRLPWLKR